jgi:SNF2 family DNA or RNA helicase
MLIYVSKYKNHYILFSKGLGKTVQTIAFLGWLKSSTNSKYPHLIVVPASTLSNWMNEIEKFCPELRYLTYHGTQKERDLMRRQLSLSIKNRFTYFIDLSYFST